MATSSGLFGNLAVQHGFLTQEQLELCLRVQTKLGNRHHLGALMVHRGFLTEQQLRELLALQQAGQADEARRAQAAGQPPPGGPGHAAFPASPVDQVARPARFGQPAASPAPTSGVRRVLVPPAPAGQGPANYAAPSYAAPPPPQASPVSMPRLPVAGAATWVNSMLEAAEKRGASDVHLHPGAPIALRQGGRLLVGSSAPLDPRELESQLHGVLKPAQREALVKELSIDALVVTPSGLRARGNLYFTNTGLNATFRLIRRAPPTLAELGLPAQLASFTNYSQGMVLVSGLAGSGKSSTLAALVNLIAEERSDHVLCLEDPVEIIHPAKKALINQRQVGRDTGSFARALRGALREDPDVIVIGELRDSETIQLAVTAAETGHLVLGSMNTASSGRAISRILGAFPPAQQQQVRTMVSESLHGVITQRLLPTIDGGRALALELLMVTPAIGNLIRDDKMFQLRGAMQTGRSQGMRVMDDSLKELVLSGRVASDEAKRVAESPNLIPAGAAAQAPAVPAPPSSPPGKQPPGKPAPFGKGR